MDGLKLLYSLPEDRKAAITQQFGSLEEFYKKVFELYKQDYFLHMNKPDGYKTQQEKIQNDIFDIEDSLDDMELDGHSIITEISSDHGEIIVNRVVSNLDNYLRQYGTTFEIMREWLKKQIGEK